MAVLDDIERLAIQVYGKATAVSVDQALKGPGWVVRCWNAKGAEVDSTGQPLAKHDALGTMRRRLQRANFLRLDASDMGLSDG